MIPEDIPAAAALEARCFSEPWTEHAYRSAFRRNGVDYFFWLAEEAGEVIGIISLTRMGEDGEIGNVAVHPDKRRRGVARHLLQTVLEYGEQELHMEAFTLEVRDGNRGAIHLYESEGFQTEGIRPGFYKKPTEDARILWRRQKGSND